MVEWISEYNGGHEQTFNIQYRIVNESQMWITQEIPQYNRQTYILSELQSNTWYELRMFAENKFDKSNATDIQSRSTLPPSVTKGMSSSLSIRILFSHIFYEHAARCVSDIKFFQCSSICMSHILVSAQ